MCSQRHHLTVEVGGALRAGPPSCARSLDGSEALLEGFYQIVQPKQVAILVVAGLPLRAVVDQCRCDMQIARAFLCDRINYA